jgi:UDP-3-O-[3-hydroxymyristoyl] glucosamine N-acyltransferase
MKFNTKQDIRSIAALLDCKITGNTENLVTGINEIHMVEPGDIVFVDHPKYYQKALESAASVILINQEVPFPEGKTLLIHPSPFKAFNFLIEHFVSQLPKIEAKVHLTATIYPNVFLGKNVTIGEHCILHAGVYIADETTIESRVIIGPNSVIGHDAFYYQKKEGDYNRLISCGGVHIEKNVEIGALCTIDRGVTGITRIGEGSKIDNQVHVGHDTQIGRNVLIAAGCGISGCVEIGNSATIWGQVGMASGVIIGDGAIILGQSGVTKNIPEGTEYFGTPAGPAKQKFKELAFLRNQVNLEP